jgi:hypothetical protein
MYIDKDKGNLEAAVLIEREYTQQDTNFNTK